MNPFFIVLLAASQLLNNKITPPVHYFGQIICNKPGCPHFNAGNEVWLYTGGVKYTYKHKKSKVTIFCQLDNNSADTFLLDRRSFSICSNSNEYVLNAWEKQSDTLCIPPLERERRFRFEFTSKYEMPRKMMGSDTLYFQYSGGGKITNIFPMVAVLKIDETWTREQIMNAYTF